jgi:hypothetical protein
MDSNTRHDIPPNVSRITCAGCGWRIQPQRLDATGSALVRRPQRGVRALVMSGGMPSPRSRPIPGCGSWPARCWVRLAIRCLSVSMSEASGRSSIRPAPRVISAHVPVMGRARPKRRNRLNRQISTRFGHVKTSPYKHEETHRPDAPGMMLRVSASELACQSLPQSRWHCPWRLYAGSRSASCCSSSS